MTKPGRQTRIEKWFEAASDLDPAAREAYLDEIAREDPPAAAEVRSLLEMRDEEEGFLEEPWIGDPEAELVGTRLGSYRLLEKLGAGGMGTVYLGARDDEDFKRRVAVKVIRPGMATAEVIQRFRTERQALARLEHPRIARLYDSGATPRGLPYFVMEHVEGEPIDRYCTRRGLSVEARLRLFREVCSAVHDAHRNLVVHRDLKPSNILVTRDGEPRLLDFGIAKLLDAESAVTATSEPRPMSPAWASPEQVVGGPITTATDVHGLGLLLYKLLTGRHPYAGEGESIGEIRASVLGRDPPPPSRTDSSGGRRRGISKDLDHVVLKALAKDPDDRYLSAQQLASDIDALLSGYPVVAGPVSLSDRAWKLVRRHPGRFAAAATALLLVTAVAVVMSVQASRLAAQRDVSARERQKAERALEFLVNTFQVSDPDSLQGQTVSAREILEEGTRRIGELAGEPEVQAAIMDTIGVVYRQLGLYDQAEPLLAEALEIRRGRLGEHPETAKSLDELAALRRAQADFESAEGLYLEALEMKRRLFGEVHAEIATTLNELGRLLSKKGDGEAAEPLLLGALEMRRRLFGSEHEDVAVSLNDLADLLVSQGHYRDAEALFREALDLQRRIHGDAHSAVSKGLNNLAATRAYQGDYESAEALYREALALQRELTGERHPLVATCLHNLASTLEHRASYEEAEKLFREALELRRELLGERHILVANTLNRLGGLLLSTGRLPQAESLFRQALDARKKALGGDHVSIAESFNNLAIVRLMRGDPAEAEDLFRQALRIYRQRLGDEHPDVARALSNLAAVRRDSGAYGEAEPLYREAIAIWQQIREDGHPEVAAPLLGLGDLLCRRGSSAEGEPKVRQALELLRRTLPEAHWRILQAQTVLGTCLGGLGRFEEAAELLRENLDALTETMGPEFPHTRKARERLDDVYEKWGKPPVTPPP